MARQRIHATELGRMLDRASQPVYVLDDQLTIVYLNRACRQWLGAAAEELDGRQCAYHSSPDTTGPDAVAAGLCPPPAIAEGRPLTASVSRAGTQGAAVYRQAHFIPLGTSSEDMIGTVAILGMQDLPEPPPAAAEPAERESLQLHEHLRQFRRQTALRHGIDRLVGNGPVMRRARALAEVAAGSRASVLLVGPRGSGRQHLATAIHYGAAAVAGALLPLDCSLLGADLVRSTIHALTGSPAGEKSRRGTLLLNAADQLPTEVQGELFSLLSARAFPLRLMATAEQSLGDLARRGRYREDLAALVGTILIELPPLAQRRQDLPVLAQLFLEEANAHASKQVGGFTPEALDRLDGYPWPGNLDELAQVVAESHQRASAPEIAPGDLPERIRLAAEAAARPRRKEEPIVLDEFLQRIERELIHRAIARAKGNKARAARLLGLTRPRLYRRMVQLGLEKAGEGTGE